MYKVQLHSWHEQYAKMGDFSGWQMPLWYKGAIQEHKHVRESLGFFDISHMAEMLITGKDALSFIDSLVTSNMAKLKPFRSKYTCVCNERGALKDDIVVYKYNDEKFFIIFNAVNKHKITAWFSSFLNVAKNCSNPDITIEDLTWDCALFAIQGPRALELASDLGVDVPKRLFSFKETQVDGIDVIVSHTGYTGEEGFELVIRDSHPFHINPEKRGEAEKIWKIFNLILEYGKKYDLEPIGLFARDTLRLEAGYTLYGNDSWEKQLAASLIDDITPLECGLSFITDFKKDFFIGKDALLLKKDNITKQHCLLVLDGKGIPRPHCKIFSDDKEIGEITSGTMSPMIKKGIALALISPEFTPFGSKVEVDIRGKRIPATVVDKPFYNPDLYGRTRK